MGKRKIPSFVFIAILVVSIIALDIARQAQFRGEKDEIVLKVLYTSEKKGWINSIAPDFPEAFNNLGLLFKEQNNISEEIACYQKALTLKPKMAQAHYNMGIALQLLGRYHDVRQYFRQAMKICHNIFHPGA